MPRCSKCGMFFLSEGGLRKHYASAHEISKQQEPSLTRFDGMYLGGHASFPNRSQTSLLVDESEVFVEKLNLHIPLSAIKEVKDLDDAHIDRQKIFVFGVSAASNNKQKYLCLIYHDGIQEQNPVFKFDNLEEVQLLINQQLAKQSSFKNETNQDN